MLDGLRNLFLQALKCDDGITATILVDKWNEAVKQVQYVFDNMTSKASMSQPERKKGHWIRGGAYPHHIFCSVCYATYVPNDEWAIWKTDGTDCWRLPREFCPHCGADMRGEKHGN